MYVNNLNRRKLDGGQNNQEPQVEALPSVVSHFYLILYAFVFPKLQRPRFRIV